MIITLDNNKNQKCKTFCDDLLWSRTKTILEVARALGKITRSFQGLGKLHNKNLEYCKTKALKQNRKKI